MDLISVLSGILIIIITGYAFNGISKINSNSNTTLTNSTADVPFFSQYDVSVLLSETNSVSANTTSSITENNANVITNSSNVTSNDLNFTFPSSSVNNVTYTTTFFSNISTSTSYPDISSETYKSQVSLHLSYNQEFLCGGTIVDHNYVVTVAHCMYYNWGGILPPIILIVYAGRKSLYENVSTQYEVEAITFHELYKSSTLDYNIALIQVKQAIPFNGEINKAITGETQIKYNSCVVTGWNKSSKELEAVNVNITYCSQMQASTGVLCARTGSTSDTLCNHTEGSSLICNGELIGILSSEPSCGLINETAVFQDLVQSVKWLPNAPQPSHSPRLWPSLKLLTLLTIVGVWLL